MIVVLAALVLVAAVVGVVVVGGLGLGTTRPRGGGEGLALAGGVAAAGVAGVVLVLLLVAVLGVGFDRSGGGDAEEVVDDEASAPAVGAAAITGTEATFDAIVRVDGSGDSLRLPAVVGALEAGAVVRVHGGGFAGGQRGVLAACDGFGARRCTDLMPVTTDGEGRLDAAYRWARADGGVLVVDVDGVRTGVVVGGADAPAVGRPKVAVDGEALRVTGLSSGGTASLVRCGRDAAVFGDCRRVATRRAGADGSLVFAVEPSSGERVIVLDATGTAVASTLVTRPSSASPVGDVDLDARRVVTGLVLAVLLFAVAVWLVRSTDWRPPAELSVEEG